ncbi:MAG: alpha/beta hydrolase family protein [Armatimonadota bacterium]
MELIFNTTGAGVTFAMLPPHAGGPAPTLLLLALAGADTLTTEPYCLVGRLLYAQGWNVVSLDLPCHGADERIGEPAGLEGWAARTAHGEDIVASFQQHVNDVVKHLVAAGAADPTRLAAAGTSRGGFLAFHSAAGNPLIRAVAAFAPVTDLLALREFAGQEDNPLVRRLALANTAETLADRAAWITIGNADERVDTDRAVGFARALTLASQQRGSACKVTLRVLPTPGHHSSPPWHQEAADWLQQTMMPVTRIHPAEALPTRHTLLAIDDVSLPLRKNVCLYLNTPTVRHEPVLAPSLPVSNAPDNLAAHFYGTVLHDAGKFRMWYYACHRGLNPDWPERKMQQVARKPGWLIGVQDGYEVYQGPLCYAESDDGISWIKPALGQVLFKGSRENNALNLPHTLVSGGAVIRDDADPDPARRYKMVYQYFPDQTEPHIAENGTLPSIACAVSPDGLHWTVTALPFVNQFVEHCSFIRHDGKYIVHSQVFPGSQWSGAYTEDGAAGGRTGVAHATYDFDRWPDLWAWAFALPEPRDATERGADNRYDQVHLGVGAASLGNICVGVYGLWHSQPFGEDFGKISCDLGLVVSNDGIHFREPAATPGQVFIHHDSSPATPMPGRHFETILCQGNGILNVGDETRIYHGRWRNVGQRGEDIAQYYRAEVALATLPRDRWGALGLNPGTDDGTVCTAPIILPADGGTLAVNADGVAGMRVDLLDEQFCPIPGFTGGEITGPDGLDCPIHWPGQALTALSGCTVRCLVRMHRLSDQTPRLYALTIVH